MGDHYETSYVKTGRDGRNPRLCVTYHDEDGRRHERTKSTKPKRESALRREAEEWRAELNRQWEEDRERRERKEAEARIPTLSAYLRDFMNGIKADGVEPSTILSYMNDERLLLEPGGGLPDLRISEIGPLQIRDWERYMLGERGLSPRSVSRALAFLKHVMLRYENLGVIDWTGIENFKGPRVRRTAPNALDRESVRTLRMWVTQGTDWFRTAVAIAIYTGMRRGEICGLRWRDIDFDERLVRVRHAIGTGPDGTYLKKPKNGKSRKFPLPLELEYVLGRRREWMLAELRRLYDGGAESRLGNIFVCGEVDGSWRDPSLVSYRWQTARDRLDIHGLERDRCPFHDLRHTFITYLLMAGVPVKTVSSIVGHSSAAMTLDVYASEDMDDMVRAASMIGSALPRHFRDEGHPLYELPEGVAERRQYFPEDIDTENQCHPKEDDSIMFTDAE